MHYLGLVRITFIRNISVTLFNVGLKIMAATWLLKNTSSFFPLVRFNTQECDDPVSSSLNTHDLSVLEGHWDRNINWGGKVNKEVSNIWRLFIAKRSKYLPFVYIIAYSMYKGYLLKSCIFENWQRHNFSMCFLSKFDL